MEANPYRARHQSLLNEYLTHDVAQVLRPVARDKFTAFVEEHVIFSMAINSLPCTWKPICNDDGRVDFFRSDRACERTTAIKNLMAAQHSSARWKGEELDLGNALRIITMTNRAHSDAILWCDQEKASFELAKLFVPGFGSDTTKTSWEKLDISALVAVIE